MEITIISPINHEFFAPLLSDSVSPTGVNFGLIVDGVACGCVQYVLQGNLAKLTHILVAEGYRRRGGGAQLLSESRRHLLRCGLSQIVCQPIYLPWDEESHLGYFLTACGFQEGDITTHRYCAPLFSFASRMPTPGAIPGLCPLSQLSASQREGLVSRGKKSPALTSLGEILPHPDLRPELSVVVIEDGRVTGYLALLQTSPTELEVAGLSYEGKDKTMTLKLLATTIALIGQQHPPETTITALITNPSMEPIIDKMLQGSPYTKYPVHIFTA